MACRSSERANEAIETLKKETNKDSITFLQLDTSNLDSVRKYVTAFLEKFDRLDILINNAGMLAKFGETTQSKEGFNMTFATNYLGPFLLTRLLIPVLRKSAPSRIVNVSPYAHIFVSMVDLHRKKTPPKFGDYAISK